MLFLLLTCLYAVPLQTEDTLKNVNVSLMLKDATIREALNILEKQSNYKFFYNSDQFNTTRKATLDFHGNMEDALKLILDKEITYVVSGKHIILKQKLISAIDRDDGNKKNQLSELQPSESALQNNMLLSDREIGGIVTDESNEPLPGVNVILKGTTIGTATDQNGMYKINVPHASAVLMFSFIGYTTVEFNIVNQTSINISLQPDSRTLNELVVVGYGSVKKSDLTGAVSSVSKKDIGDRQVSGLASLIQGRAAGVDVSQGTIRIRGITTFNNSDPLVVIDGFIGGNLATVNANDIENIEVLKDASSTAIYGSRGANGVILITTKNGESGPMKINVSYYEGISQVPKKLDVMNANQYTDFALEILGNSGIAATQKLLSGETRVDRTDWQDEIFKTGQNRELNIDFSGGSDHANYFLGMGYRRTENPTFLGMSDDNVYLRIKNNFNIRKWLKAGNNFAFTYNNFRGGGEAGNPGNLDQTITAPTYFPVTDSTGNYSTGNLLTDIVGMRNPLITGSNNHISGIGLNYQVALWAEVEPIKGLTYKIQAGVGGDFGRDQTSNNSYTGGIAGGATLPARITKTNYYDFSPLIEQYITYRNTIGKHNFSIMAGNTWQNGFTSGRSGIFGQDLDLSIPNVLTAPIHLVIEDKISKYAYLSYFGRLNYQFNNKYLLTMNMRADGSPRFAPSNRWSMFPSVAVAWKVHEENFIKSFNLFDQLKLRAGWGLSGNDAVGEFRYLSQVYSVNVYYPFGVQGARHNGATVINNASNDIKWESAETISIGADMAFLRNKLTITADYYRKETRDILYEVPQATSLGYGDSGGSGSAIVNAASMENQGVELQLGYRSKFKDLDFSFSGNYTHNKNKVTSLGDGSYLDGINRTDTGNPLGYFYGFIADGIFMSQQDLDAANAAAQEKGLNEFQLGTTAPGDVRFRDINGDGHVDNNDRTRIGSPHPIHTFGLNLNLDFKGVDFNMFLQGILGSSIYDGNYDKVRGGSFVLNQSTYVLNRWQSERNPGNGVVPRAVLSDPAQNNRPSTLKLSDGDYLKIRQVSIGYSLSKSFCQRIGVDNLRIYCSAYNYITFSKYKYGYDPEVGGSNLSRGIDSGNSWPRPKMVMLGFQARLN